MLQYLQIHRRRLLINGIRWSMVGLFAVVLAVGLFRDQAHADYTYTPGCDAPANNGSYYTEHCYYYVSNNSGGNNIDDTTTVTASVPADVDTSKMYIISIDAHDTGYFNGPGFALGVGSCGSGNNCSQNMHQQMSASGGSFGVTIRTLGPGGQSRSDIYFEFDKLAVPTVSLTANGQKGSVSVPYGSSPTVAWSSTGSQTSCTGSDDFAPNGPVAATGSVPVSAVTKPLTLTVTCTNAAGSGKDTLTITPGAAPTFTVTPSTGQAPLAVTATALNVPNSYPVAGACPTGATSQAITEGFDEFADAATSFGWSVTTKGTGTSATVKKATGNPATGNALELAGSGAGNQVSVTAPTTSALTGSLTFDVKPTDTTGWLVVDLASQAGTMAELKIGPPGSGNAASSATYQASAWNTFKIGWDANAKTFNVSLNNKSVSASALTFTTPTNAGALTSFTMSDGDGATGGAAAGTFDLDNIVYPGCTPTLAWNFGDTVQAQGNQQSGAAATASYTYPSGGNYSVSLTIAGQTLPSQSVVVTTSPAPLPGPKLTVTPTSGPAPLTVTATETAVGAGTSHTWDFGDGSPAVTNTDVSVTHQYTKLGSFPLAVTVNGQTQKQTVGVTAAALTVTITPTSGTAPLDVTGTVSGANAGDKVSWDFGDGITATANGNDTVKHTYVNGGSYTVKVTQSNASGQQTVAVTAPRLISAGGSLGINLGLAALFSLITTYAFLHRRHE